MEIFLYTLLALISFVWFFILNPRLNRSGTKKFPPGPTGLPVVGYLLQLGPKPHIKLAELSKRYGPLMSLKFGSVNTIVASSPEFAKQILQKHDQVFSGRPLPDAIQAQPNPEATIAWVPGDHQWKNRRRICNTQLFTTQRLELLQHLRVEKARAVRALIRKHCGSSDPVDLGRLEFAMSLNLISNSIFSVDLVDPDSDSAQEFKDLVWRIMEDASKPNVSDYFPMIRRFDLQGVKRHISSSYVRLHEIFDELIDQRLKARELDPMTPKGDFLDVLLDQCQEKGSEFSRVTIKPMMVKKLEVLPVHKFELKVAFL
ncbi:Cytochrome P450 [Dillenia turbinata]|uniref:Cytochrome P450 n=1 Tax=Dillenia turbinata TaxID=194707 RepID=A0AAN8WFD5_9MAGN